MTIYISEMELWDKVNEIYERILGEHKPARAIVPVKDLHFGTKIEIQAIAAVKENRRNLAIRSHIDKEDADVLEVAADHILIISGFFVCRRSLDRFT